MLFRSQFNAAFIAGAVDWLATGDELASIRSRGARDPRLSKIQDPVARNSTILVAYALNLLFVPGALVVFGLMKRRKRRSLVRLDMVVASAADSGEAGK